MVRFSAQQTMPLFTGTRLGHYDMMALIGEGGMGQVYRTPTRRSTGTWRT